MSNRLDIVIFGATGFTGKRVILELAKLVQAEELSLSWGVAGRSEKKLKDALAEAGKKLGRDYSSIPIITADVNDENSLSTMTRQAQVIINTVGPFSLYGEAVVQACVETSTNYVDISGEPQYIEAMNQKYNEKAVEKGIFIISACGVDSIPSDLGVVFLQNNFHGVLNTVEAYGEIMSGNGPGATGNNGTWDSIIHSIPHLKKVYETYPQLYRKNIPDFKPKIPGRGLLHKSEVVNKWAFPMLSADEFVVMRSQKFFYDHDRQRPASIKLYGCINSVCAMFQLTIFAIVLFMFIPFECTRKLLLKHPKFFSGGYFSREGPSEEKQEQTKFQMTLVGNGWAEKLIDPSCEYTTPPDKTVVARVSGTNPAYGFSSITVSLTAITILKEKSKIPVGGGVLSPGAAFARTSIIEKLCKHGVKFEIIK